MQQMAMCRPRHALSPTNIQHVVTIFSLCGTKKKDVRRDTTLDASYNLSLSFYGQIIYLCFMQYSRKFFFMPGKMWLPTDGGMTKEFQTDRPSGQTPKRSVNCITNFNLVFKPCFDFPSRKHVYEENYLQANKKFGI
jgi:hypothetical protein